MDHIGVSGGACAQRAAGTGAAPATVRDSRGGEMSGRRRKKAPREKDMTSRYMRGDLDEDREEAGEKFSDRSKHAVQRKVEKTAALQSAKEDFDGDINALPVGE